MIDIQDPRETQGPQAPSTPTPGTQTPAMDAGVLDREAEHLQQRFPEVTDVAGARAELQTAYDELAATTRHPNMLTASALNLATQRLRERAKQQGSLESRHPRVLFVCHGNAGRSQMASALLVNRSEGRIPAPECGHAVAAAIDEALAAKETGAEKVILFNFSGHGFLDLAAYDDHNHGRLTDEMG